MQPVPALGFHQRILAPCPTLWTAWLRLFPVNDFNLRIAIYFALL
jgi:hypothetical protein